MLLYVNVRSFVTFFEFGLFADVKSSGIEPVGSLLRHVQALNLVIAGDLLVNFLSRLSISEEGNSLSCKVISYYE